jgi:hypothetical protein
MAGIIPREAAAANGESSEALDSFFGGGRGLQSYPISKGNQRRTWPETLRNAKSRRLKSMSAPKNVFRFDILLYAALTLDALSVAFQTAAPQTSTSSLPRDSWREDQQINHPVRKSLRLLFKLLQPGLLDCLDLSLDDLQPLHVPSKGGDRVGRQGLALWCADSLQLHARLA